MAGEITVLLEALREGDRAAFDRLVPLVYDELRRIARRQLRAGPGRTLQTTALVHEAWMKLAGQEGLAVNDRGHFLAVCARAMRQVVVDLARAAAAAKRDGKRDAVPVDEVEVGLEARADELLDVNRAVERLRERSERLATAVECRYFAGLSEEETAAALGVSLRTAQREWTRARAWLGEALREGSAP